MTMNDSRMIQEPKIWSTFEVERDGEKCKVIIKSLTPDLFEPALDHMCTYFIERENISKSMDFKDDPLATSDMREFWLEAVKEGLAIVAIIEGDKHAPPHNLIGANITFLAKKDEKIDFSFMTSEKCKLLMDGLTKAAKECDIYNKYGVDKYLSALGLSVHPAYNGIKLGQRMLEAREAVCKAYGIKVTATIFTASQSQHVAEKAGFHNIQDWIYEDFKVDGRVAFPKAIGKMSMKARVFDM